MFLLLIFSIIVCKLNSQQYFQPPQNINGTFGLQLNTYPSPQHLLQKQQQQQYPSTLDYRQQKQFNTGHYSPPNYPSQLNNNPNYLHSSNNWQNGQKMGEEEENYKNEENNNFASTNHLSFDPNNNLPYFQDRQRGYNQIFNGDKHSFDFENEVENSPYYHYYGQRSGNPNIHQMDRQYQQQQHPFSGGPLNPQYHKSIVYPEGQRGGNNHKNFWFNNSNKLIINFWLLIIFYLIIQIIKI